MLSIEIYLKLKYVCRYMFTYVLNMYPPLFMKTYIIMNIIMHIIMKTYIFMNVIMHIIGHDDDVTAIALSNNGLLVATGLFVD
jgi:hypothetical protein